MSTEATVHRLQQIRQRHDEASTDWSLGESGTQIVARVVPGTAPVVVLDSTDDCGWQDLEFVSHAHADVAFMLQLLRELYREHQRNQPVERPHHSRREQEERKQKSNAQDCAVKCGTRLFRRFLVEKYGVPDVADDERVAVSIRNILRVQSRTELDTDPSAAKRWLDFRATFEAWKVHV
jgi:hypothetical protein